MKDDGEGRSDGGRRGDVTRSGMVGLSRRTRRGCRCCDHLGDARDYPDVQGSERTGSAGGPQWKNEKKERTDATASPMTLALGGKQFLTRVFLFILLTCKLIIK